MSGLAPRDRLVAALDVPDAAQARVLARTLAPHVGVLKVGLELFIAEGPALVRELAELRPIFLDLKLHDIPATVARAAAAAARLGVRWLTVHPGDEAVRAAVQAAPDVRLLLVTLLTSEAAGEGAGALVVERARRARELGCGGVICSGHEAAAVREACGAGLEIITPGIRPAGTDAGDQARVMTPSAAVAAGADRIVVGRPIRDATDPAQAAAAIVASLT